MISESPKTEEPEDLDMNEAEVASVDMLQLDSAKQHLATMPRVDQALLRQQRLELPKYADLDHAQFRALLSRAEWR